MRAEDRAKFLLEKFSEESEYISCEECLMYKACRFLHEHGEPNNCARINEGINIEE